MKRVFLALIPVALMTTASLALPGLTPEPLKIFTPAVQPLAQAPALSTPITTAPVIAQSAPVPAKPQPKVLAQSTQQTTQTPPPVVQEVPLPQLVVDKTQLVEAMSFLVRATEQAKLSVTALDVEAQRAYIQEAINLLAGSADAHFRQIGQSTGSYPGAVALLSQSLQARETSEAAWLAEMQKFSGEVAGADTPAAAAPAVTTILGTRGLRPEEQASQLIERAIAQATMALAAATLPPDSDVRAQELGARFASEEATSIMESVVKFLESALKVVQIAIDR